MPSVSPPEITSPAGQDRWRIDRARILREATIEFLSKPHTTDGDIRRYEALAVGLLPRLSRDEAIEIARMLAERETLSSAILEAFAAHGIRLKHVMTQSDEAHSDGADITGVPQMPDNGANLHTSEGLQRSISAGSWHIVGLDPVLALALSRAAMRKDYQDFAAIMKPALHQIGIVLNDDAIQRIYADDTGELAAMLIAALGGDAVLVTHTLTSLFDMASNRPRLQATLHTFGTLSPDLAIRVLQDYFMIPKGMPMRRGIHAPLQSGEAKRGRESPAQNAPTRSMLSARMTKAYRSQR